MSKCLNLEVDQRTTPKYEIIVKKNGKYVDISDWTIYFTVKQNIKDSDASAKIKKDITSHLDGENGKSLIALTATETDLQGTHHYSIDYKDGDDNEGVLYWGRLLFRKRARDNT